MGKKDVRSRLEKKKKKKKTGEACGKVVNREQKRKKGRILTILQVFFYTYTYIRKFTKIKSMTIK